MSNITEANDDSEIDVESIPDCKSSSKSSFHINWTSESNTFKSSYGCSPNSYLSEDEAEDVENKDWEVVNQLYLRKLEEYKASQQDSDEDVHNSCRLIHSAPLTLPTISGQFCTLKSIDETEEFPLNDSLETSNRDETVEVLLTPRQKEVPPKRKCIRAVTPALSKQQVTPEENCFPNQRINIGAKTFIVRSLRKTEKRSICTQVDEENDQVTNLPHSVEDGSPSNVTLEPNIIILDHKSSSGKSCNSPMGDAPFCEENHWNRVKNVPVKKRVSKRNVVGSMERNSEISPPSTTNFSVFTTRTSNKTTPRNVSNPSLVITTSSEGTPTRPVEAIESRSDADVSTKLKNNDFCLDKETCRAILGDFRLETTSDSDARPISCEETKMRRRHRRDVSGTFKEKGSELMKLLQDAGDEDGIKVGMGDSSNNPGEIRRITPKTKMLIDTRREQSVDIEFYDVESSTTPECLKAPNEIFTPEVEVGNDYEEVCCVCLKFLRLNR